MLLQNESILSKIEIIEFKRYLSQEKSLNDSYRATFS
jgi:hypothetical protein